MLADQGPGSAVGAQSRGIDDEGMQVVRHGEAPVFEHYVQYNIMSVYVSQE